MLKKLLLLAGIWGGLVWGQSPPFNLQISQQPLPPVVNMFANYTGAIGQTTNFYWVVARYGVGNSALSSSTQVNGIASTGSVAIGWNAPASPSGYTLAYDVLRTTSATFPVNGTCVSCLVSSATTSLTATDSLGALSNYNLATYNPQPSPITLTLDNVNASQVLLKGIVNGTNIFPLSSVIGSNGQFFYNNNGVYSATSNLTTDGNNIQSNPTFNDSFVAIGSGIIRAAPVFNFSQAATALPISAMQASLTIGASNTQNWTNAGLSSHSNLFTTILGASGTITGISVVRSAFAFGSTTTTITSGYLFHGLTNGAGTKPVSVAGLAIDTFGAGPTNTSYITLGQATNTIPTGNFAINDSTGFVSALTGVQSVGTKFTATGCTNSATLGGATSGQYTSGTTGVCTVVITMNGATGLTATNGWYCQANDTTTAADTVHQIAPISATQATLSGTTASGDVITFGCTGY